MMRIDRNYFRRYQVMKKIVFLFIILFATTASFAAHLKGGWIQYEYISTDPNTHVSRYAITVRQYLLCSSNAGQIDQQIYLGIFDGATNALFKTVTVALSGTDIPNKTTYDPCISSPPPVCYRIDKYVALVDLPENVGGYVLTVQRCCRIAGIVNVSNSNTIGVTYTNKIPGMINGVSYVNNSSPVFAQKDTAVVCYNGHFTFDFSAYDNDGDSLSYTFCNGLVGGGTASSGGGAQPNPPSAPT